MQTDTLRVALAEGYLTKLTDPDSDRNYLPAGEPAPLMQVRVSGVDHAPNGMDWVHPGQVLDLRYDQVDLTARVEVTVAASHLRFRLASITSHDRVELIVWGPYPTTISQTIGETVGVVHDDRYAIGIQSLQPKTLGGFPENDDDTAPATRTFADDGDLTDIPQDLVGEQLLRGHTAVRTRFGSRLQAFCRHRHQARVIDNMGQAHYLSPAVDDGGVIGSSIALFGAPAAGALDAIGAIEGAEGLPHPTLDGEWAKTSRQATASYLIMDFGEETIQAAIDLTRRAGLRYLYHSSPFETWGHFQLRQDAFPDGWTSFKGCVDRATEAGLRVGFHTLSNFITTNDPYVTPTPDPRLAVIGAARLAAAVDATQDTIAIDDPLFFRKGTTLNTVRVGDELIQFRGLSDGAPWFLLGCERGAWGTIPACHATGEPICRLMDHGYKVFLTDIALATEVAARIADFCNQTGAAQLSFDGLEGNFSTGLGDYATSLFTKAWYESLDPGLQGQIINDASMPGHYNWHTYTRMNWGEPWYAGFRESQTQYRLQNQHYYRRNLMPHMLGWFTLHSDTSIEDIEWLLARAAGFDAGFALSTRVEFAGDQLRGADSVPDGGGQTGQLDEIVDAIRAWETARMAGAFPDSIKPRLQDIGEEFHLEPRGQDRWDLYPVHSRKERLEAPGIVTFDNPYASQPLQAIVRNAGQTPIADLTLATGGREVPLGDGVLAPGATVRQPDPFPATPACREGLLQADMGEQRVRLNWTRTAGADGDLSVELRTIGPPWNL